jgi:GntR family transcriptional regulator/MocR family aminotransferase
VKRSTSPDFAPRTARSRQQTLFHWLYSELRDAILSSRLPSGARLPSSRGLANQFGVSRTIVVSVFDQLIAEGYVTARVGSGTVVNADQHQSRSITSTSERTKKEKEAARARKSPIPAPPATISIVRAAAKPRPFESNIPALDHFPQKLWARIVGRRSRIQNYKSLLDGDPKGYKPLRELLADYLSLTRGVQCSVDSVIIISGVQQALDLSTRLTLKPRDSVWMEDPGYPGARHIFSLASAKVVPMAVDGEGMIIPQQDRQIKSPKMIYVTPARQSPTGVTMSPARRLALLHLASMHGSWIFEDDYDGEFRYSARPLAALQGLDQSDSVIHCGTFSKVMFPALRLGYVVLPQALIDPFVSLISLSTRFVPTLEQVVLCDFVEGGHFSRHVRTMRELYASRHAAIVEAGGKYLSGLLEFGPAAGLEAIGWLPAGANDQKIAATAARAGIVVRAVSENAIRAKPRPGLVIGAAAYNIPTIDSGMRLLARTLNA